MKANDILLEALRDINACQPPNALFRFNRKNDLSALTDGKLKLTPPIFFNDPFEMWVGIASETLTEEKMVRSVTAPQGLFKMAMRRERPQTMRDTTAYDLRLAAEVRATPEHWSKHLSSLVGAVKVLGSGQIGVFCLSGFSASEILEEIGIRHWAMYGDDHRGFCIEFDGQHDFFKNIAEAKWLFPVNYLASRCLIDLEEFDEWTDQKMWRIIREWLAMKSERAWGHEKEWRVIHPIGATFKHWWFHFEGHGAKQRYFLRLWTPEHSTEEKTRGSMAIRRVWLGCRVDSEVKSAVLTAVREKHLRHVEVWELTPCSRDFRLVPNRVV